MRSITKGSIVFAMTMLSAACSGDISSAPLAPAGAALSQAGGKVSLPFRGTVSSADASQVVGANLEITGTIEGTATHLGRYSATVVAVAPLGGPPTATGTYVFTTANGDHITATMDGWSAPDGFGDFIFTEVLTIVGGTGRFASATGTLTITKTVVIDFSTNSSTGSGTIEGSIELNH
jgi:hypothetical protein